MKTRSRGLTSLLLSLSFLVLIISGIVLFLSPKGRVAFWTNWTLLGLSKEDWEAIHINISVLVLAVSGFHLYFNWTLFVKYIKVRTKWAFNMKKEMLASTLIVTLIVVGSLFGLPPFSTVMNLHDKSQAFWEERAPRAPAPHAEEFSLGHLAKTIGLSIEEVTTALEKEGFTPESRFISVRELGEKHGVAPSEVYAAITKHHQKLRKVRCGGKKGACSKNKLSGKQ